MLKELLEGHFYGTFPKVSGCVLNLTEFSLSGEFSLLDPKACGGCHFVCSSNPADREQLKVSRRPPIWSLQSCSIASGLNQP